MEDPNPYTVDPYGTAMTAIKDALEAALDDGVSGKMSEHEYGVLTTLAKLTTDSGTDVDPRQG